MAEASKPENVKVYGPGVEQGVKTFQPTFFTVDCKEAGPGMYTKIPYTRTLCMVSKNQIYLLILIKKTSFEVKHCKIETVFISRSAQAAKLKKTYI